MVKVKKGKLSLLLSNHCTLRAYGAWSYSGMHSVALAVGECLSHFAWEEFYSLLGSRSGLVW
jgi:hypothetical protein